MTGVHHYVKKGRNFTAMHDGVLDWVTNGEKRPKLRSVLQKSVRESGKVVKLLLESFIINFFQMNNLLYLYNFIVITPLCACVV